MEIEESLKIYTHKNFMGRVENADKDKKIVGAVTKKAVFKKWYQMGILGVFNFMVVNGQVTWNISVDEKSAI